MDTLRPEPPSLIEVWSPLISHENSVGQALTYEPTGIVGSLLMHVYVEMLPFLWIAILI